MASEAQGVADRAGSRGQKRKQPPLPAGTKPVKKVKKSSGAKDDLIRAAAAAAAAATGADNGEREGGGGEGSSGKSRRVRTGCLTCRERHLKCDEGLPNCNNCSKSHRRCKRGVRLNFIDTWAERPPRIVSLFGTKDWHVDFRDESREIAADYQGGEERYQAVDATLDVEGDPTAADSSAISGSQATAAPPSKTPYPSLPPIQGMSNVPSTNPVPPQQSTTTYDPNLLDGHNNDDLSQAPRSESTNHSNSNHSAVGPGSVNSFSQGRVDRLPNDADGRKGYLDNAEETLFMQVFVEEIGLWMDSMDPQKHFSRLLPFDSLLEPMLLNAFLACGAKHLTLVNPVYTEDRALHYYDTATSYLLKNLQDPERDTVVCATTAVILNVYEIMSERATQRMNHIAGARALIKECGWNARSSGVGAACFWLNVGLEVLSCLHFNWQVAWDPDKWCVDMDFSRGSQCGQEELWTHRMLYIVAKVCNFRATITSSVVSDGGAADSRHRYDEWCHLKHLADAWYDKLPRVMKPMAYVPRFQTRSTSAFPEVWLVKRTTIVAQLFYHMALLLLAQTNPYYRTDYSTDMAELQNTHALMICGIAAHVKDRGVASVAIRSLAHAAEVLTDRREQGEVLQIFDRINKETGWRIGFIYKELKEKWGWLEDVSPQQFAQTHTAARQLREAQETAHQQQHQLNQNLQQHAQAAQSLHYQQYQNSQQLQDLPTLPSAESQQPQRQASPPPRKMPQGIPNPLYAKADFSLPQHPYQKFYVAPSHNASGADL